MVAVLHPVGPGRQIVLDRAVVLVGRSPDCDAVLDMSTRISRIHCALVQVDHAHFIRDLGSTNGVWVNGKRVRRESRLNNGVTLAIGDIRFQFFENLQPASRQPAAPKIPETPSEPSRAYPVLVDETVSQPAAVNPRPARRSTEDDVVLLPDEPSDDVELIDVELVDIAEEVDEVITLESVEIIDHVELFDDVQVIDPHADDVIEVDDVQVIDEVEVIEDVELIEDVEILEDPHQGDHPRRPRRR